ncbi:hypothetical protein KJI55_004327 [Escherichia coli]|nr:hypothetical protein [Escherichia coli]
MRSFFSARNLLLANKKTTATNGGLFAGSRTTNSFSEGNWLLQSADYLKLVLVLFRFLAH